MDTIENNSLKLSKSAAESIVSIIIHLRLNAIFSTQLNVWSRVDVLRACQDIVLRYSNALLFREGEKTTRRNKYDAKVKHSEEPTNADIIVIQCVVCCVIGALRIFFSLSLSLQINYV